MFIKYKNIISPQCNNYTIDASNCSKTNLQKSGVLTYFP